LVWLRRNDSALLKDFAATARQAQRLQPSRECLGERAKEFMPMRDAF